MSIILQIWDNFYVISLQVLTKKGQNTRRIYEDLQPPTHHSIPRTRKVILHVKIFSLNKKNQIFPAVIKISNCISSRKQPHVPYSGYNHVLK